MKNEIRTMQTPLGGDATAPSGPGQQPHLQVPALRGNEVCAVTTDDIIKLAGHRKPSPWVIKLVADAVAAEREACAKVADAWDVENKLSNYGRCIGVRIRARGQQ
jgi:lysine/ornithine N-monooxygenase